MLVATALLQLAASGESRELLFAAPAPAGPSVDDPVLPYFAGAVGETCRLAKVAEWESANSAMKVTLDATMATTLYKIAKTHCQPEIDRYNAASALVCYLEDKDPPAVKYGRFWSQITDPDSRAVSISTVNTISPPCLACRP